jgi:molybdopterin-containing oxidoreductase family iron-sulfur binding subunit
MGMKRRDFLKGMGGLCAVAGLGAAGTMAVKDRAEASGGGLEEKAAPSAHRWGMVIDLTKFNDDLIDRCAAACHKAHNVPKFDNIKDEIKWIWGESYEGAFPSKSHQFVSEGFEDRHVPVLCNHCENPPCVRVCPTKATFKRPDGIVLMDFHRCIGCRFCMAGCPYGSRSFNWQIPRIDAKTLVGGAKIVKDFPTRERGVVEKCNFCAERIAKGPKPGPGHELTKEQMPLCVLKSDGAMVFGNLNDKESRIRDVLRHSHTINRKSELGTNPSVFYIV